MATALVPSVIGRPPIPNQREIIQDICDRVSRGELASAACEIHNIGRTTLFRWCEESEEFRNMYARARVNQAHALAEQSLRIAHGDDALTEAYREAIEVATDNMEPSKARKLANQLEANLVQRDRLRVDTLKWYTSKLAPRLYGEKVAVEHSGPDGGPIQQEWTFGVRKIGF